MSTTLSTKGLAQALKLYGSSEIVDKFVDKRKKSILPEIMLSLKIFP